MALEHLASVDPGQTEKVRAYQNEYWRAMSVKRWIEDGIIAGLNATEILEERSE